jgi:hypothetical protein
MDKFLVRNAVQCLNCNDIIESTFRHDYIKCSCGGCAVDGGLDYVRTGYRDGIDFVELYMYSTDPHWAIREHVKRIGYGKIGASDYGKFRVTLLKDMTDEHLIALMTYCLPNNKFLPIYKNEIEYRKQNNIKIDETSNNTENN